MVIGNVYRKLGTFLNLVKFGRVVFEVCQQIDKTDGHADTQYFVPLPGGGE